MRRWLSWQRTQVPSPASKIGKPAVVHAHQEAGETEAGGLGLTGQSLAKSRSSGFWEKLTQRARREAVEEDARHGPLIAT